MGVDDERRVKEQPRRRPPELGAAKAPIRRPAVAPVASHDPVDPATRRKALEPALRRRRASRPAHASPVRDARGSPPHRRRVRGLACVRRPGRLVPEPARGWWWRHPLARSRVSGDGARADRRHNRPGRVPPSAATASSDRWYRRLRSGARHGLRRLVSDWSIGERATEPGHGGLEPAVKSSGQEFVIEDSLGYLVNRAARSLAHQLAEELRPAGVGIGQWAVLMFLWARDGMSQAELSRVFAIDAAKMVRTIDRMVRDGLVTRVPDPDDGRVTRIRLTERGRSLRDELVPKATAVNARNLNRITEREGRTLKRLLAKLLVEPDR